MRNIWPNGHFNPNPGVSALKDFGLSNIWGLNEREVVRNSGIGYAGSVLLLLFITSLLELWEETHGTTEGLGITSGREM